MNDDASGYAVFFFPPALEALGAAIKPYLQEGDAGPHVLCREVDTGGSLLEMTMDGEDPQGRRVQVELMVPTSMVRMIVSLQSDQSFGFGPRLAPVQAANDVPPAAADAEATPQPPAGAEPATDPAADPGS